MNLQTIRLGIAAVGVAVWFYAQRVDSTEIRWFGIGMLAVAVLLRFMPARARKDIPPE